MVSMPVTFYFVWKHILPFLKRCSTRWYSLFKMLSALMEIWVWLSPWRSIHWVVEIVPCTRMKSNSFLFPLFRKSAMQREEEGSLGLLLWSFLLLRSIAPLVSLSNDSAFSFLRHASTLMKADTRLFSSPFLSLRPKNVPGCLSFWGHRDMLIET